MIDRAELLRLASDASACKPALLKMRNDLTTDELLDLYKENIDFCLDENFPPKEYLTEKAGLATLSGSGIFIDTAIELKINKEHFGVILGKSFAFAMYEKYSVSQLFIKHESFANIEVKDNAFLIIDCFDNAKLDVEASGFAKVLVNVYGDATVSINEIDAGAIKVVRKGKRKYE